jgi:hypothetical protein
MIAAIEAPHRGRLTPIISGAAWQPFDPPAPVALAKLIEGHHYCPYRRGGDGAERRTVTGGHRRWEALRPSCRPSWPVAKRSLVRGRRWPYQLGLVASPPSLAAPRCLGLGLVTGPVERLRHPWRRGCDRCPLASPIALCRQNDNQALAREWAPWPSSSRVGEPTAGAGRAAGSTRRPVSWIRAVALAAPVATSLSRSLGFPA